MAKFKITRGHIHAESTVIEAESLKDAIELIDKIENDVEWVPDEKESRPMTSYIKEIKE